MTNEQNTDTLPELPQDYSAYGYCAMSLGLLAGAGYMMYSLFSFDITAMAMRLFGG
jgi:hypothetical protein